VARDLFDTNAGSYDRTNTIISLGLDARWRDWAAHKAVLRPDVAVLDAFAGTGLVGLRCAELGGRVTLADISPRMLEVAEQRAAEAGLGLQTFTGDLTAAELDVPGAPFDAITLMFGVRYLDDPASVLRRLSALLRPYGSIVVVDFVEPDDSLLATLAAVYFFRVLPPVASWLSGKPELYRELVSTTHDLGPAKHLVSIVKSAGLEIAETRAMGFGLVCGVVGRRS
jgi:demethylmenaquinone methyltransferase/2-methoxy-6-polyprenyl-1,4-benzoquinol methylase